MEFGKEDTVWHLTWQQSKRALGKNWLRKLFLRCRADVSHQLVFLHQVEGVGHVEQVEQGVGHVEKGVEHVETVEQNVYDACMICIMRAKPNRMLNQPGPAQDPVISNVHACA